MKKLNNYGLWVALGALLFLVLQDLIPNFNEGRYDLYVDAILGVLIAAGIISNPVAGKWFADTDKEDKIEKDDK